MRLRWWRKPPPTVEDLWQARLRRHHEDMLRLHDSPSGICPIDNVYVRKCPTYRESRENLGYPDRLLQYPIHSIIA